MAYRETIQYLFGLQKQGIKFGLANSARIMERLGDPHRRFRSFHIAGTNGKGSTAAFLAGMLRAAGYRTGLYSSPHLVSFTERIRVDNGMISEDRVVELAERVRRSIDGLPSDGGGAMSPTFFEVTTAMAFTHFAEAGVEAAVIETGMGGRLDSTNVITPLVSVITNIDLEHTEFLGTTLEQIAGEKAGIIKPGVPVVTGAVQPETLAVIERTAAGCASPLYRMPADFRPERVSPGPPQRFDYHGIAARFPGLAVNLLGGHQVGNACLAVAAVECAAQAGIAVPEEAVRTGLAATAWEGRLERLARRPDLYVDGAHNPASAAVLAESLKELKRSYRRLILVLGILKDKDHAGIIARLVPLADRVIATRPRYERALDAAELAAAVSRLGGAAISAATMEEAVGLARAGASEGDLIVVTGSLYTVGDARALLAGSADGPFRELKG